MRLLSPMAIASCVLGCLVNFSCTDARTTLTLSPPAVALASTSSLEALAGFWRLTVDPTSLVASLTPEPLREAADNDDLYLLSTNRFFTSGVIQITEVQTTDTTLDINYQITHPIPAPTDPTAAASASNRADLGIAGRLAFLVEVPTATGNTYFSDRVANTSLIVNPDHYYAPAGLLSTLVLPANTFPCQTLVDELNGGSRVDINNGGSPTGNFGTDGWTRAELGTSNDGWTGYGVLHQGQSSARRVSIDLAALSAIGTLDINVALLVRYNDPRGGADSDQKRANRLPPADPDHAKFAYRMPHGALDGAPVQFISDSGTFEADLASTSTLSFTVVDWDARATETSETNLFEDPDVTRVAVGESGAPSLAICIPGVLGTGAIVDLWDPTTLTDDDSSIGGDLAADSGLPGDALYYSKTVSKSGLTGQTGGTYTGMVRITDPEAALPSPLAVALDAATLAPLTADLPEAVTYQSFTVEQQPGPTGVPGWVATFGGDEQARADAVAVNATGQAAVSGYDGVVAVPSRAKAYASRLTETGAPDFEQTYQSTQSTYGNGVAIDAAGNTYVTGNFTSATDFGQGLVSPQGLTDCYVMKLDATGGTIWLRTFGGANAHARANGLALDGLGRVLVTGSIHGTVNLGGVPRIAGLESTFVLQLSSGGIYQWDRTVIGAMGLNYGTAIEAGPNDVAVVIGRFTGDLDFGGGLRNGNGDFDAFTLQLTQAGSYLWDHTWGTDQIEWAHDVAVDPNSGRVFVGGQTDGAVLGQVHTAGDDGVLLALTNSGTLDWAMQFDGSVDDGIYGIAVGPYGRLYATGAFADMCAACNGGVPATGSFDGFVVRLTLDGVPIWRRSFGGTGFDKPQAIDVDGDGDLRIAGLFNGTCDFDPGPGLLSRTATDQDGFVLRLSGSTGFLE